MREAVRGRVGDYLEAKWPEAGNVSGRLVERLFSSFAERSGVHTGLASLEDVIKAKGFTRQEFHQIVGQLVALRALPTALDAALTSLKAEGFGGRKADNLYKAAIRLNTQMVANPAVKTEMFWDEAVSAAQQFGSSDAYLPAVMEVTDTIRKSAATENRRLIFNELDLNAISLLAIIHVDQQSTPASP